MNYKLGIIGVGKMGSAILGGIIKSGLIKKGDMLLCDAFKDNLERLKGEGYSVTGYAKDIFDTCSAFILSVKPQSLGEITEFAETIDFSGKLVISICAGISAGYLKKCFKGADVIRCMPNTPALINMGVTTIAPYASESSIEFAKKIFSSVGKVYEIDESLMDLTVPLNGSMPAYLYAFAREFIKSAEKSGVPYETAKGLVAESIISSANMILKSDDDIDTLIKNVCSKGGTTIAGLDKLYDGNFSGAIEDCFIACANRSKELSK